MIGNQTVRPTRTFDVLTQLKDNAGAVTASGNAQVAAADKIVFLGAGIMEADLVTDVYAIDTTSADEKYEIEFQLSDSATFASGIVVAEVIKLGALASTGSSANSGAGRYLNGVSNLFDGHAYAYCRLYHRISGTTPSITYAAYLGKDDQ
jgi:hypothetical protein